MKDHAEAYNREFLPVAWDILRRTVEKEIKAMALTSGEGEMAATELVGGLMLSAELRARIRKCKLIKYILKNFIV